MATGFESSAHDKQRPKRRRLMKVGHMKKGKRTSRVTEMCAEYDFSGGERGKYSKRYEEGTNIIILDPDVAELFPDSKAVNEALRALSKIAARQRHKAARSR
jgi:hypothetical protein